ncbi:hypothetical protein OROGR_026912 [Orobanche gracilis]
MGETDTETRRKIEEAVLEILKNSNMDETTEYKIRKSAADKLEMDLSEPTRKKIVRDVVDSYLRAQQAETEEEQKEEEKEVEEEDDEKDKGDREYDDEGGLIICRVRDVLIPPLGRDYRPFVPAGLSYVLVGYDNYVPELRGDHSRCLSEKRRVTLSEFKGKISIAIREYYKKDGKELPSAKGINLTSEQWVSFKKNVPAIEKTIQKMKSR